MPPGSTVVVVPQGAQGGEAPTPPPIEKSKLSGSVYAGIAAVLIILVAVLDFILQNLETANIHFFSAHFRLPVGVVVLLGAIGGAVIVLLICLYQFVRMRRAIHRQTHQTHQTRQRAN